ncbi:MAG TPA: ABC transporter permease [Pyrinomonadaceae bacterium]
MATLWQDFRYGIRAAIKNPIFAIILIVTLALGIGANTAIFSVVNAVLLRPLPYAESDRLVIVFSAWPAQGIRKAGSALPDYREYRDQNHTLESLGGFFYSDFNLSAGNQTPERVQGALITSNLFPVLRVAPVIGQNFLPEDQKWGQHHVALLSYGLWQRQLGGDPNIVGRQINLNGATYTVRGVMPLGMVFFDNLPQVDLWTPISFAPDDNMDSRNNHFVQLVGRLKPGVTVDQASSDMNRIALALEKQFKENQGQGAVTASLQEELVGDSRRALLVLLAGVGFVLLVACSNIANLLLARTAAREREFTIRASLGAGRVRLLRQLLMEALPLGLFGGGTGILLAGWILSLIRSLMPSTLPRHNAIIMDWHVLAFAAVLSLLTVLFFGILPALSAWSRHLREGLNEGGRGTTTGRRRNRMRSALVTVEIALALVLLTGAGLMIRTLRNLNHTDTGFVATNLLTMRVPLSVAKYPDDAKALNFYERLLERLRAVAGVQSAAAGSRLPLGFGGSWGKNFSIEGHPLATSLAQVPSVQFVLVSPDYFRTGGITLLKGREFTDQDIEKAQQVAIVNETIARRFFNNEDPLGKTIWMGPPENLLPAPQPGQRSQTFKRRSIVGVIHDVKDGPINQDPQPTVYVPYYQFDHEGWSTMAVVVRTTSTPSAYVATMRDIVRSLDPDQPVAQVASGEELLSRRLSEPRFNTLLLASFAGLGLLLAAIGIYGVVSFLVTQRTHEFGIRIALGAQKTNLLKLVIGKGVVLSLIGVTLGLGASLILTRLMTGLIYGVDSTDPVTLIAVAGLLTTVTIIASYIPARRATKVDPLTALRYE